MSKQTAVEWLVDELLSGKPLMPSLIEQAKQMEKELLFEYWKGGQASDDEGGLSFDVYHNGTELNSTDKKLHISDVIPSFRKRYFFNGIFWEKQDEGKRLEIMTNEEIEVMKKNTVEGQWLLDGKFEDRTDIRTWVTEENWV
jgi:hypothetical protein